MANHRNGVPAGWTWRDGRPRWEPSPSLRKAGWKGRDLKDGSGQWLGRGPSISAADAIAQAVAAWRADEPVPVAFAGICPAGAIAGSGPAPGLDPLSIGALVAEYLAHPETQRLAPGTQRDYAGKLRRLVDALAGYARRPDPVELDQHARAVAAINAASVFILEPVETPKGLSDPLYAAYWKLHEHAGVHMAAGVLACASAWLTWCRQRKTRRIQNWAADVSRETPPGRIRILTWPEIAALVAAADTLDLPEVGDAILLAIDLAWSEVDVLTLTWGQIVKRDGRRVALGARQKTGRVGGTPFLSIGLRRLAQIRRRQRHMAAQPLRVIHLPRQRHHAKRRPQADGEHLRRLFAQVRAEAAKACPSVASATFADTRDTGFTLSRNAGLTDAGVASRSRHSLATVRTMGDKHYGEVGPAIAGPAADALDLYVEAEIRRHGVKL